MASSSSIDIGPNPPNTSHQFLLHDLQHKDESSSEPPARARRMETPPILSFSGWLWELMNLALALGSLAAIIAIMARYSDEPTPEWYSGLTLNAAISILSTVYRGSLLAPVASSIGQFGWLKMRKSSVSLDSVAVYDRAGSGPIGSLWFLGSRKILHFAAIGALLTVLATTLDSFFQQAVQFELGSSPTPDIQAVTLAAYEWNGLNGQVSLFENAANVLPTQMRAAVYSGLFSYNALSVGPIESPPFICPTGNCTFPSFLTLGVNTMCVDTTSRIERVCGEDGPTPGAPKRCSLIAPNNPLLNDTLAGTASRLAFASSGHNGRDAPRDPGITSQWADVPGIISIIPWVRTLNGRGPNNSTGAFSYIINTTEIESGVCAFYFTVYEMRNRIRNGFYIEDIDNQFRDMNYIDRSASLGIANTTIGGITYHYQNRTSSYPLVFAPRDESGSPMLTKGPRSLRIAGESFTALSSLLTGTLTDEDSPTDNPVVGRVIYNAVPGAIGTAAALTLYNARSISDLLGIMAVYMTNSLRANDTILQRYETGNGSAMAESQSVAGTSLMSVQFVRVQWAWLTLPIFCFVLAVFFTTTAILRSRNSGFGLWKDSPLTLLFHSQLDEQATAYIDEKRPLLASVDGMEGVGRRLHGRFARSQEAAKAITVSLINR